MAGDTSRPKCPCDDQERQPLAGQNGPRSGAVSEGDTRSPCGGRALPSSGTAGRLLPVDVTKTPTLSVEVPRSVPSRISVVLVDGTMAGDTPERECLREDGIWRLRAGETRPAGMSVGGGDAGLPRVGETLSSLDVAGRFPLVVPAGGSSSVGTANPVGSNGPVVAGSSIDPCETLSPLFYDALGPLEYLVLDETILGLDPVEHSGLDHAETILGLDPLEHSGPDHADPAGQHAIFQDVLEPLEHSVLDTALDGRPMAGFPVLEPIEHSVLEITLDGGHSEMTIDEEP